MRQFSYLLLVSLFTLLFFSGCSDKDDPEPTTALEIIVLDESGNPVENANVQLYQTEEDWKELKNQLGKTKATDKTGKVTFTGLKGATYFWFARKECKNSYNNNSSTLSVIPANQTTSLETVLTPTSRFEFKNSSDKSYHILKDGEPHLTVKPGTTFINSFHSPGVYSYVFRNAIQTHTLKCGGTLVIEVFI